MSSPARFAFFEEEITPAKAIVSSDICGWLETKKKEILPQRKKKLVALPLRPNHESSTIAILKNNRAELFQSSDKKQTETLPSTNKSQTVSPLSSDNYGAKHLNKPAVVVS